MKKAQTLVLLILVVFLAGCINQPKGAVVSTNGIIIKSFSPDISEVTGGELVPITLTIENVGESKATNIFAELYNIDTRTEWELRSGKITQGPISLIGVNPSLNIFTGESYDFSWAVRAPKRNTDLVYTPSTRIMYKYLTSATTTLKVITNDYLKSLPLEQQESIKKTSGIISSKVSGGPLGVSFSVGNRPLIIYEDKADFSLQIVITNVGGGGTFLGTVEKMEDLKEEKLRLVNAKVSKGGIDTIFCSPTANGDVTLTAGKSRTLFCTLTINKNTVGTSKEFTLDVALNYGYYVDSSTTVKVLKSEAAEITPTPTEKCVDSDDGDNKEVAGDCRDGGIPQKDKCVDIQTAQGPQKIGIEEAFCESSTKCGYKTLTNCKNYCNTKYGREGEGCKETDGKAYCDCGGVRVNFQGVNCNTQGRVAFSINIDDNSYSIPGTTEGSTIALDAKQHTIKEISPSVPCDEVTCEYKGMKCTREGTIQVLPTTTLSPPILLQLGSDDAGKDVSCVVYYRQKDSTVTCPLS